MAATDTQQQTADVREYTIDAQGKRLGRIATEAATVLMGKDRPDYAANLVAAVRVQIVNARLLDISEKRGLETFQRYSGYPGGQKDETWEHLINRRGHGELVRRVVDGMLPKNKLRKRRLQNLEVTE